MTTRGLVHTLLEPPARAIVATVHVLARHRLLTSVLGLALVLALGTGYLVVGSLQINPLRSQYQVRVELAESGGLLAGQDVALRGMPVGRVQSVHLEPDKIVAIVTIDSDIHIPANGDVRVTSLSAAGEQFLDFLPTAEHGPYLSNGSVIAPEHTATPIPMATVLGDASGTLDQIDPAKIATIVHQIGAGPAGPDKLAGILNGGMFLLTTLGSVLPQTTTLLNNSKTVLTTLGNAAPTLESTAANLNRTTAGIASMTGGYRSLVGTAPSTLTGIDNVIADNSASMVKILANLTVTARMTHGHAPALQEFFFPQQRTGSVLDAIRTGFHDGGIWALVSIYPRYACDYNLPRAAGSAPDSPEPYLNARCDNHNPSVLVRGADNAPRPPDDHTATTPPGADPRQKADPTPTGPLTIPTPYGGPYVPKISVPQR
ncbi:MlaD family protein [Nocardia miyunensis]|uniref:MlaD family protein n=1 Tax=Nocardia miyunensis TaxID=282684 RepID=UPI00082E6D70|nr:MlaD family protein [Nocardia miyunensis]